MDSERVFACGVTGSGKTEFLARRFLPRAPRLLIVDQTGEWADREKYAPYCFGYEDTVSVLGEHAGKDRWRIICSVTPAEVSQLATRMLVPSPRPRDGFAASVGGMAVLLDEVDILTPNGRAPAELTHLWRRGRHVGLSVYAATQRPANVSKEVTAQCRWICVLRQHEVRDIKYLSDLIGADVIGHVMPVVNRVPYSVLLWDSQLRAGYILDKNGHVRGTARPAGWKPQQDLFS